MRSPKKDLITLLLLVIVAVLLIHGLQLEYEEKAESPLHAYYLETYHSAGTINLVEAILLNYRAYDTFGEVMVLYVSIAGILILGEQNKEGDDR